MIKEVKILISFNVLEQNYSDSSARQIYSDFKNDTLQWFRKRYRNLSNLEIKKMKKEEK